MTLRLVAASLLAAALLASLAATPGIATNLSGVLRTVAVSGQTAPGTDGAVFREQDAFFLTASMNNLGQVAFAATLRPGAGVTSDNDLGVWSEGSGALALVARENNQAPGTPDGVLFGQTFTPPAINDGGETGFHSNLKGTGVTATSDGSVWSELSGALALAAREANQAPGTEAGVNFASLNNIRLAEDHIGFGGRLVSNIAGVTTTNDSGLWRGGASTAELVAREGHQAPGTPAGAVFGDFDGVSPVMGAGGHLAFRSSLRTGAGGVTTSNDIALWSMGGGALGLVAREGSPAPGVSPTANFQAFQSATPSINGLGHVAFAASLPIGGTVTSSNDTGLWSQGGDGVLKLIAREGDPAPGVNGGLMGPFTDMITINDAGDTAFWSTFQVGPGGVTENNAQALFVERDGQLSLFARQGSQAPGVPSGVNFFFNGRIPPTLLLNNAGRAAVMASLSTATNDIGIWAEDLTGTLRLIVRSGDVLEVAPGDFRTVTTLRLRGSSGANSDQGSAFNDAGQVAFIANFVGGTSGVFVSNLATLPEPHALALGALGAVWGAAVCRRGGILGVSLASRQ